MESNELREAYIAAGLERNEHGQWFLPCDGGTPAYAYFEDDPALNPFAAELLTAKVRELPNSHLYGYHSIPSLGTSEERIRASMAVLGGGA